LDWKLFGALVLCLNLKNIKKSTLKTLEKWKGEQVSQTLNPSKECATSKPQKPQITSSFPEITHKETGGFVGVGYLSSIFFSEPWVSNILGFDIYPWFSTFLKKMSNIWFKKISVFFNET
jgi:hypothetical protein